MRQILLLLPALLIGCASAGSVEGQVSEEQIEEYIRTEQPRPALAKIMRRKKLATTMTKTQVRLVMGAKRGYTAEPDETRSRSDDLKVWVYRSSSGPTYQILFGPDGRVEDLSRE